MFFAAVMFMGLELDRSNINQALTDGFLEELGMRPNVQDYNTGNTVFKLAFLCAELPSQLIAKWIGPDIWVPTQMVVWSVVGSGQFFLRGRNSFLITRAMLGMLQGGFIPEIILYLSYFYKHHELSLRLGFFWTASAMADVCGGFLAFGILHLHGLGGQAGWRWLFLIEGGITLIVGLLAAVLMPSSPTATASLFRGREGWFTVREELILTNRILREDPSKSSMHNREPLTPRLLIRSFFDYDLWPMYLLGLTFQTPMTTPQNYLTLTLKGMGFGTFNTNLLVIPSQVGHIITMLGLTYASEVFGELTLTALIGQIWALPFIVFIYIVDINSINRWAAWFILTVLLSYPNGMLDSLTSLQIQKLIVYSTSSPRNRTLLILLFLNITLYVLTKIYYIKRNAYKDSKWNGMSEDEKLEYLATTKDEGNKRLDFRFAH
ncbi:hypothetical protein NHQ30_005854 [Ciborinia camelliae]|nr:hypothetical protein NHQ30_005854 [Ciborinia camelliae]